MVVGFTITCAIGAYHHWSCEFESHYWNIVENGPIKYTEYHNL
jgi:hypothetical protein